MKLKTSQSYAIEGASQLEGSFDLKLLGTEYISIIDKTHQAAIEHNQISSATNSFFSVYGLGHKFFYHAQQFRSSKVFRYEVGLGYLENHDGTFVLKRSQPLFFSEYNQEISQVPGNPRPLYCGPDEFLIVTTYLPRTYIEILTDPNCLISSVAPHTPSLTYVSENSLVGRFGDFIESYPIDQLLSIPLVSQTVVDTITNYTKQLILKSSKLTCKNINTDYVALKPLSSKPPEKDGILFFNKEHNTICYYADNCWRELTWQRCLDETSS